MSKAKLRTKSGCLTCRKRKVKCGEERSSCINCVTSNRPCEWPSQVSLIDGRSRRRSSQAEVDRTRRSSECSIINEQDQENKSNHGMDDTMLLRSLSALSTIRSDMDSELLIHYHDSLYIMLLSTAHEGFHEDYRWRIINLGFSCEGVKCAMLAWSASNKFVRSNDSRYRQAALGYYSQAVSSVKEGISKLESSPKQRLDDSMMIMIEYLYLHSLWGSDTGVDARKHVTGAMNLLSLRYGDANDMVRPFDRVSVESVLYQAFLLHMRFPFSPNFHVDDEFLHQTEFLLGYLGFEDAGAAGNSPVLGLPLDLYRLILRIITYFGSSTLEEPITLAQLHDQTKYWERCLTLVDDADCDSPLDGNPHLDVITLYILTTSLLLDLMVRYHSNVPPTVAESDQAADREHWQVSRVLATFYDSSNYEKYTSCYIILWPMLILGYAVQSQGDIHFIKQILQDMRQRMGYGEVQRVHDELDTFWTSTSNRMKRVDSKDLYLDYPLELKL